MRLLRHIVEAFFVYLIFYAFKMMPIDIASSVGGWIGRKIGKIIKPSRIAFQNLTLAFPKMGDEKKWQIIDQMWDNLGRMVGELPHIHSMSDEEFARRVNFINVPKKFPKCALFVSGHFANFELPARMAQLHKFKIHLVHRPANNPFVNHLINSHREICGASMIKKGKVGIKQMLEMAKTKKGVIGMLVDQKTNTGIDVPFFGREVKTTPFPANFALKYKIPIYITRMKRIDGANFIIEVMEPIKITKDSNAHSIMFLINSTLEKWIKESPEQWFWVHRRWGK